MTIPAVLPELARDSQLATVVTSDCCEHFFAETPTLTRKEVWKRTKRLGSGGFGTVWLETCIEGQDGENSIYRAVKVLQLPTDAPVSEAIPRYGRELEALAKFSQRKFARCFVKSYGWYEDASSISICLEYLPLGDLQAFIARRADRKLPETEVQQIVSQVLDGLVFMHVEGFAHRDLKPANILIKSHESDSWWIKLSDFGLSKRTQATCGASGIQGTPGFMAPELWGYVTHDRPTRKTIWYPADLWSLGEIAFQLATGRPTFPKPEMLMKYTLGQCEFPAIELQNAMVNQSMVDFITGIMLVDYTKRPTAEAASAHPWLWELRRESLVLSHGKFDARKSQELSSGESSVLEHTASSIAGYRDWSTISSAPAISLRDRVGFRPAPDALKETVEITKSVADTDQPTQDMLNHRPGPAVFAQRLSGLSRPSLPRFPSPERAPGSRSPLIIPGWRDSDEEESESEVRATLERGLAAGTKWYPDASLDRQKGSNDSTNGPRHLITKTVTTPVMEKLTRSSSNKMTEVFRITALDGTQSGCHQLVFSPDSKALATTSTGNYVGLWSIKQRSLIRTVESLGKYVAFSPDSRHVAAVQDTGAACIVQASLDRHYGGPRLSPRGLAEEARCIAFSPNGDQLVAGTSRGVLIIWDSITGKTVKKIKSQPENVVWVTYYPTRYRYNTHEIVAAGADGWFRFWEHEARSILPDRWSPVKSLGAKGRDKIGLNVLSGISAAAASKSFARLAVANLDGSITVWYNEKDHHWILGLDRESVLQGHEELIHTMEFSPDSKLLVSASNGSVKIWQVRGGLPVAVVPRPVGGTLRSVAFSPDSAWVASTSSDGVVKLWDAEDIQNLSDVQDHLDRASFVAVSPDQRYAVSVVRELRSTGIKRNPFSTCDEPLKHRLAVDTDIATLMIWNVEEAKPLLLLSGHEAEILSVSFSEDSRRMGSISADHVLRIWDVETGNCLHTITSLIGAEDTMPCAAISTGLRYCAAVFRYHYISRRASHSGYAISLCYTCPEPQASTDPYPCIALVGTAVKDDILAVAFSPDATKLAAVDQNENVTLWSTANGSMTARLSDFAQPVPQSRSPFKFDWRSSQHFAAYRAHIFDVGSPALHFTSSGLQLVVSSGLSSARLWNIEDGGQLLCRVGVRNVDFSRTTKKRHRIYEEICTVPGSGLNNSAFKYCSYSVPLAASPDGTRCVASYSSSSPSSSTVGPRVALWDMRTGEAIALLAEYAHSSDLHHVSFSPDSRWLVTASSKDIMVRHALTGRETTEITVGLSWPLRMVAFWPDSRYLVSGCSEGMLQFWDVERGVMVKAFEGHTGRRRFAV